MVGIGLATVETKRQLGYIPLNDHGAGANPGVAIQGPVAAPTAFGPADSWFPCQGSDLGLRDVTPDMLPTYTTGECQAVQFGPLPQFLRPGERPAYLSSPLAPAAERGGSTISRHNDLRSAPHSTDFRGDVNENYTDFLICIACRLLRSYKGRKTVTSVRQGTAENG